MTDTVILTQPQVRALLPMRACMDLMATTLSSLSRGEGVNPLRWPMWIPDRRGLIGMMPGMSDDPEALGLKVVAVFPGNHGTQYDSHQGVVLLFDPQNGLPLAIMDASEITAIRTAAVSGMVTERLARADASVVSIIGSGVQARTHLEAMAEARTLTEVRVFSRSEENRTRFVKRASSTYDFPVRAMASAEEAVRESDIVCTVTSSKEPVLLGAWLEPGMHVNAAGSSVKPARELDTQAVVRSKLFVDRKESTLNEAGDFLYPKEEGAIDDSHIVAEIGEILLGNHPGRGSDGEVTLFKSLGLAVEDLAAGHYVWERALAEGVGTRVALGGLTDLGGD
jgi:ornithine cyclodeaminase/alanine dehydrogenase-like protein (mu-crystallin family)